MIYFITNCKKTLEYYSTKDFLNITVLEDNESTYSFFKNWAAKKYIEEDAICAFDKETNGLDAHINSSLLDIIGDTNTQFVFHSPYSCFKKYIWYIKRKYLILGHNIKFDIKFLLVESGIRLSKVYDTMIAEQRIYMKFGFLYALQELMIRYLNEYPKGADKRIREEFIGCDVHKFEVLPRHIYYAADDVAHLITIRDKQQKYIDKYKMNFLLYNIEFPLIYSIALAEITGWDFDLDKWLSIYEDNKKDKFLNEIELDKEVRKLRDSSIKNNPDLKLTMKGGKWDNERKHNPTYDVFNADGTTNTPDLFGDMMAVNTLIKSKAKAPKKIDRFPNNINYDSDTQIIEIFGRLKEPLLTKKELLITPSFDTRGKLDKQNHSFTTGKDAMVMYKNMLPNSRMITFIDLLTKNRGLATAVNNFGINFKSKINPVTGKIHTIFRQCEAVTGRLQSGGGRREPDKYNAQNIPSKGDRAIEMRNCFIAPSGYSIGTHDYTGAELIVMCSMSQDMQLLEISKKDIHSYVAQAFWRNIYKFRAYSLIDQVKRIRAAYTPTYVNDEIKKTIKTINNYIHLSKNYIVDKTTGGGKIRTDAKPLTFGAIYGMHDAKAAKSAKVNKEEGQIIIDTLKRLFPKVFTMVEAASTFAKAHGYVILNTRTNSRMWFPTIIRVLKRIVEQRDVFVQYMAEANEARNGRIQGTQADAVKEATVDLQAYIDEHNLDVIILKWVHDEIVDRHPKYLDGKSKEWKKWIKENPEGLSFIMDDGIEHTGKSFPEIKRLIMINTFNRYLTNVTIDVDYSVEPYWTK